MGRCKNNWYDLMDEKTGEGIKPLRPLKRNRIGFYMQQQAKSIVA